VNPELLRNLWLEFSIRRLIAMPLVLALIFAAPLINEQPKHDDAAATVTLFASPFPDANTSLVVPATPNSAMFTPGGPTMLLSLLIPGAAQHVVTGGLFFAIAVAVLLFLWGTRLAADSLYSEVVGRTWDSQRSSTIGPWAMTVGKLFGATAYVWYGAVFCLAFWGYLQFYRPATVIAVLLAGLWSQSLALFVALLLLRTAPDRTRFRVTLAQAVVLPVAAVLFYGFANQAEVTHWYGFLLPGAWVLPISLLLAVGWTLVGIYQLMRGQLQLPVQPAAWIGFLVMLGVYAGGFAFHPGMILSAGWTASFPAAAARSLLLAATAIVLLAPVSALLSPPALLPLRQLLSGKASARWRDVPPWIWPLLFAGALIALASIFEASGGGTAFFGTVFDGPAALAAFLLLLFAVRDIGILHIAALDPASRRGVLATIVVLALSYLALPMLARALHAGDLIPIFRPDFFMSPRWSVGIALFDGIVVWLLAARNFRRLGRQLPVVVLAGLLLCAPRAWSASLADAPCPRVSAHEMLMEAGLIFEGHLLSQGPPPECAANKMMCGQEVLTFRVDRLLKGEGKPNSTVTVRRMQISQRSLTTADPRLAVPESGLFVLLGRPLNPGLAGAVTYQDDEDGEDGVFLPGNYTIDECLLGLPPDFAAQAEAYAAKRAELTAIDKSTAATTAALAGYLLRNRDTAARPILEHALLAYPSSQAIRAQYLYDSDQTGLLTRNPFFWNMVKTRQPALAEALTTATTPDPDNIWVKLLAIRTRLRPAEENSPLSALKDFSAYFLTGLQFADASLHGASFVDAHIANSDFRGSDLTGADLRWAEFENVDLSFALLSDANLEDWNPATRMGNALMRRFGWRADGLGRTRQVVNPQFTITLRRSILDRARMERATLIGADLRQASLKQAILRDADLRQADLRGADLSGADLSGAVLDGARFDCRTAWPAGFVPAGRPDPASDTILCRESLITKQ